MASSGSRQYNNATMSDNDKHLLDIVLEDVNDKFQTLIEGQTAMASVPEDIRQLKEDMSEVKGDIRAIKAVVTDHSALLLNHDQQLADMRRATS